MRKENVKTSHLLHLSTTADSKISGQPWVKFQSAGWVNIQSAPTGQGLTVRKKPNGDALVMRSHFEQVMNPVTNIKPAGRREPNRIGLIASFEKQA